jgi:thiol:disulfide interchange protein DsbD
MVIASVGCRKPVRSGTDEKGRTDAVSAVDLLVERETVRPGTTVYLGVRIRLAPGWHTYSNPPGDSGMAPSLTLDVPDGVQAGALEYPPHREFRDAAGTTYGYEREVLLRVPVSVSEDVQEQGSVRIAGTLDYLVCRETCLPQSARLDGLFTIGSASSAPTPEWRRAFGEGRWKSEQKNE